MIATGRLLLPSCLLLGVAWSPTARSVDFEITPFAGYRFGGQFEDRATAEDVDIEESASFGIAIDAEYSPGQAIQVFYSRQSSQMQDISPAIDMDVEYFHVGGVVIFPHEELLPYAVGTIGATRFSAGPGGVDDETRFSVSLGGGLKHFFTPRLGVRLEARGYFTFVDTDADVFCVSDQGVATCLLRTSGSAVWQIEAQAGVTFRF